MASETGGVKGFSIQGRLYRERERLNGMTDAERAWRKQWVKDQHLHNEPKVVPEIYKELYNPIRRAYRAPLDALFAPLMPVLGEPLAQGIRVITGKVLLGIAAVYVGAYYLKYNAHDWTRKGGVRISQSRPAVYPGEPGYPYVSERKVGADYGSRGFDKSPI